MLLTADHDSSALRNASSQVSQALWTAGAWKIYTAQRLQMFPNAANYT